MADVVVTAQDLFAVRLGARQGLCMSGARAWAARHGFDWADFLRSGVDADRLEATGDPLAALVVAAARARVTGE